MRHESSISTDENAVRYESSAIVNISNSDCDDCRGMLVKKWYSSSPYVCCCRKCVCLQFDDDYENAEEYAPFAG